MADAVSAIGRRPWWEQGTMRFAKQGLGHLRRRFPALAHLHDDLIAETLLGIAHHLGQSPKGAPASWFESAEPEQPEQSRFFALCHAILGRRVNDHFRSRAARWIDDSAGLLDSAPEPASESPAVDRAFDLRRAVAKLLAAVDRLPTQDQLLLERATLGDSLGPMSMSERQRLHRLRLALGTHLEVVLGAHPLEFTRRD
jgi:DNA-directed RNA polymerase specialized sigma24 family protein